MSNNGTKETRRKYDEGFKQNALKMIDNGQPVRSVAQSFGVGENLLHKWKTARRSGSSEVEREVIELRARNRQLEMERDIFRTFSNVRNKLKLRDENDTTTILSILAYQSN